MKSLSLPVLRIGLAISFIWVGILIFQDPISWGSLITPWAKNILFVPLGTFTTIVAVFDILIGVLLVLNFLPRIVSFLAVLHFIAVIVVVFDHSAIVARDIGLLSASLSVFLSS